MNVKCPNCRYKFDVNPTDVSENNEVSCSCPRCGTSFASQYIAPATEYVDNQIQQPALDKNRMSQPAVTQDQEADMYFAVMKRMKTGQYEEAGDYLSKLLELKPNEPIYLNIKNQLDGIKHSYLLATKYIQSGNLDQAELHVNKLLEISPNDPMYLSLKDELNEAQQKQEEKNRQREEANKAIERKRRDELEKKVDIASKLLHIKLPKSDILTDVVGNLNESQLKETSELIQEMPDYLKSYLEKQPGDFLSEWFKNSMAEKRQWIAINKSKLMPPEVSRKIQEDQLYRAANDHLMRGEFDKARDSVNRLLEMNPNDSRYQDLYLKLGSHTNSASGCMVLVLAVIISIASIIVL